MSLQIDEAEVNRFFFGAGKPGMDYCYRKATQIESLAKQNAHGSIIGIKTGRLLAFMRVSSHIRGNDSSYVEVGTSATSAIGGGTSRSPEAITPEGFTITNENFSYPAWHDQHGRPWLTNAVLRAGFRRK